jgi:hypothetical protein
MDMSMSVLGQDFRVIQIGEEAWFNVTGVWEAVPGSVESLGVPESPTDLMEGFLPQEIVEGATVTTETVNGVETTRYSINTDLFKSLVAG